MKISFRKSDSFLKPISGVVYDLPVSVNLSVWWNFGSLLGLCLGVQLVSGIFLAMHYSPGLDVAFSSVIHIVRDVNGGWLLRSIHANGASFFFICVYFHVGRGIYYGSYQMVHVWGSGVVMLFVLMGIAFMGYVLPWGQMSYWGATVITNMVTAIPYIGKDILHWLWGGYTVSNPTLVRFYVFHFLLPFILVVLVMVHIVVLHDAGSNNPLGLEGMGDKVPFHIYYSMKDVFGFSVMVGALLFVCLLSPDIFLESENFNPANPLVTPVHIQPEWYFLFAYAILRSIPNKGGGVLALVLSVAGLLLLPLLTSNCSGCLSSSMNPLNQIMFWGFVGVFLILTWIGMCPVESPFTMIGQISTFLYFLFLIVYPISVSSKVGGM
uniref:Cytochrome b n=2 Tax=Loripes TaxID=244478 RepID=C9V3L7_9BIVA|nr:cytochrome b [Loripes lacteus]ABJ55672.1 cytochrome b [Loripes lacteus]UUJ36989.1 cytochrome b [Loripes orbiculatus]